MRIRDSLTGVSESWLEPIPGAETINGVSQMRRVTKRLDGGDHYNVITRSPDGQEFREWKLRADTPQQAAEIVRARELELDEGFELEPVTKLDQE